MGVLRARRQEIHLLRRGYCGSVIDGKQGSCLNVPEASHYLERVLANLSLSLIRIHGFSYVSVC